MGKPFWCVGHRGPTCPPAWLQMPSERGPRLDKDLRRGTRTEAALDHRHEPCIGIGVVELTTVRRGQQGFCLPVRPWTAGGPSVHRRRRAGASLARRRRNAVVCTQSGLLSKCVLQARGGGGGADHSGFMHFPRIIIIGGWIFSGFVYYSLHRCQVSYEYHDPDFDAVVQHIHKYAAPSCLSVAPSPCPRPVSDAPPPPPPS